MSVEEMAKILKAFMVHCPQSYKMYTILYAFFNLLYSLNLYIFEHSIRDEEEEEEEEEEEAGR